MAEVENMIKNVSEKLKSKLNQFNAPTEHVDEIVREASKFHSKSESALQTWATKIYFSRYPDVADKIHTEWHFA